MSVDKDYFSVVIKEGTKPEQSRLLKQMQDEFFAQGGVMTRLERGKEKYFAGPNSERLQELP